MADRQDEVGRRLRGAAERVEAARALDGVMGPLARGAAALHRNGAMSRMLGGRWLGHALHPVLTDFPLGMWIGATTLDYVGGRGSQRAADTLVAGGILAALPTMAAGLHDWWTLPRPGQRVGVVHAASNTTAWSLYVCSLIARRRGHRVRGVLLSTAAGVFANIGGYLGGHLTLVRGDTASRS